MTYKCIFNKKTNHPVQLLNCCFQEKKRKPFALVLLSLQSIDDWDHHDSGE